MSAKAHRFTYKKMQIGTVDSVNWQSKTEDFAIKLAIDKIPALAEKARMCSGVTAPWILAPVLPVLMLRSRRFKGALKGSISLGLLDSNGKASNAANLKLYESKRLALTQAQAVSSHPTRLKQTGGQTAIRYQVIKWVKCRR